MSYNPMDEIATLHFAVERYVAPRPVLDWGEKGRCRGDLLRLGTGGGPDTVGLDVWAAGAPAKETKRAG